MQTQQFPMTPFIKLAQSNMDLMTRFAASPEVTSQATANASLLFQQATESATKLMHSAAFTQMVQGMLKNYTEFLMELSQSGVSMMGQLQATLVQRTQEAADGVVGATGSRGLRNFRSA